MSQRSRRNDAPARNTVRQPRRPTDFLPSKRQIGIAVDVITSTLKHFELKAHDHHEAAKMLFKQIGHGARQLGNTDGQRRITIRLVLEKLVGEKTIKLLDKEYVLAA